MTLDIVLDWDWDIKADVVSWKKKNVLIVCQHCKENEERPSCDRGVWWRGSAQKVPKWDRWPQAKTSRGKCHPSFSLLIRVPFRLSMQVAWLQHFLPTDMWMTSLQVSSVTHTTATEKEFLAQLLQEKDQLQREQEDRIKNLTKLIITSSTLVPVHKVSYDTKLEKENSFLCIIFIVMMMNVSTLRCQNAEWHGEERWSDWPVRLSVAHLTSALQTL